MSITDELRRNIKASEQFYGRKLPSLTAIADRIDTEHQKAINELNGLAAASVPLPKDADNVPWNPGDRDEDGDVVTELRLTSDGWFIITDGEWPYRPESKCHYQGGRMSAQILKNYVDERGNICVRVGENVQVLTCDEADRIEAEYKRMQAENAKLREEFDKMDVWHSKELTAAMAEIDKLREMVRGLHMAYVETLNECESVTEGLIWECSGNIDSDIAESRAKFEVNRHRFDDALRELGVEVSK